MKEMLEHHDELQKRRPYHLEVPITFRSSHNSSANSTEELWKTFNDSVVMSMFRGEVLGVIKSPLQTEEKEATIFPLGSQLEAGTYRAVISTFLAQEDLEDIVYPAIAGLQRARPHTPLSSSSLSSSSLSKEITNLEQALLVQFTHASLVQEGSTITLQETELIAGKLAGRDPLHKLDDVEMSSLVEQTTSEEVEVVEAVNHLQVVQLLGDFINGTKEINEDNIFFLHRHLMHRLLTKEDEGLPGEYRKVTIGIEGSSLPRSPTEQVPQLMKEFYMTLDQGPSEDELTHSFLTRIHTQFQLIHPFRDGNGRIGRIIMNIMLLRKGYPILYYVPEHRGLFCLACENKSMFERMILEAFYASLRMYERVIGPLITNNILMPNK